MKKWKIIFILWPLVSFSLYSDSQPFQKDNRDGTVTDIRTKLIWQKCSLGQKNNSECSGAPSDYEWEDAIKGCTNLSLAGKKWRLPTIEELDSFVLSDQESSGESTVFPNTEASYYWSSTKEADKKNISWYRDFSTGKSHFDSTSNLGFVRCVTGTYKPPTYTNNNDGTVTDQSTNLTWQKCSVGQKNDRKCSFPARVYDWEDAINACESLTLANKKWRLPSISELQTLVIKIDRKNPYIDSTFFPNTQPNYWTWDSVMCTNYAYFLRFPSGILDSDSRESKRYFVRCVTNSTNEGN